MLPIYPTITQLLIGGFIMFKLTDEQIQAINQFQHLNLHGNVVNVLTMVQVLDQQFPKLFPLTPTDIKDLKTQIKQLILGKDNTKANIQIQDVTQLINLPQDTQVYTNQDQFPHFHNTKNLTAMSIANRNKYTTNGQKADIITNIEYHHNQTKSDLSYQPTTNSLTLMMHAFVNHQPKPELNQQLTINLDNWLTTDLYHDLLLSMQKLIADNPKVDEFHYCLNENDQSIINPLAQPDKKTPFYSINSLAHFLFSPVINTYERAHNIALKHHGKTINVFSWSNIDFTELDNENFVNQTTNPQEFLKTHTNFNLIYQNLIKPIIKPKYDTLLNAANLLNAICSQSEFTSIDQNGQKKTIDIKLILKDNYQIDYLSANSEEANNYSEQLTQFYYQNEHADGLQYNPCTRICYHIENPAKIAQLTAMFKLLELEDTIMNNTISSSLLKPLIHLIYLQQNHFNYQIDNQNDNQVDINVKIKKLHQQLSTGMQTFLKKYTLPNEEFNHQENITIGNITDYVLALRHNQPLNPNMFALVTNTQTTQNDSHKVILEQVINNHLEDQLMQITDQQQIKHIKHNISADFRDKIGNIYAIKNQTNNDPEHKLQHMTLVHGTKNMSILSILANGLLDSKTLAAQNNQHYHYTASGLGNGIYFAQPKEIEKSANYLGHNNNCTHYIFMADVAYHETYETNHYDDYTSTKQDLIYAHAVGSYDRDEIVAHHPEQVQIKYLLEIK